jgi:hypothetical protein
MEIELDRVVEVALIADREREFAGTGYVIGPGLVLTASHVLFDMRRPVPSTIEVVVRSLADLGRVAQEILDEPEGSPDWMARYDKVIDERGDHWRDAELIWPPANRPRSIFDLAILEVSRREPADSYHRFSAVPLATITGISTELECRTCGFPIWRRRISGPFKLERATLRTGHLSAPPPNDPITTDLIVRGDAPADSRQWKGMSGGPVWYSGPTDGREAPPPALIGVVGTVDDSKNNRLLTVTTFPPWVSKKDNKADPYGFWRAANRMDEAERVAAGVTPTAVVLAKPADYIHIVNRRAHDGEVVEKCNLRYATGSNKPAVILLHGRDVDDPTRYPARWRSGDLEYKRLTGNVIQLRSGIISWPTTYGPEAREQRFKKLKAEILKSAVENQMESSAAANLGPKLNEDDPPNRFQSYFAAGRLPRTFSLILRPAQVKPVDYEVMSDFLKFFGAAAAGPEVVTLFIGLTYVPDLTPASFIDLAPDWEPCSKVAAEVWTALRQCVVQRENDLHVWDVGALTQIDMTDVDEWQLKLERKNVRPPESFFSALSARIAPQTSVPLTRFSDLVLPQSPGAP